MAHDAQSHSSQNSVGLTTDQLKDILEVSRLFAITADLESLLHIIANAACRMLHCDRASIWLYDPTTQELYTTVILQAKQLRVPANTGIVGAAFNDNRVVNVADAYNDRRFNPSGDKATGYKTNSLMAMPMVDIKGSAVGVIQAVNKIQGIFNQQDEDLVRLLAAQAGVAIQRHHLQAAADKAVEMQHEMDLARKVQQALLPKDLPTLAGFDFFGWAKPASTIGGDCYDLWMLSDGRLGIFLADAAGHGLAPAMVVSQARTLVRALCECLPPACSPHDVLVRVNQRMADDANDGRFITAFLGFLSPNGILEWQSAGHAPLLMRHAADSPIQQLTAVVPPINILSDLPDEFPQPMILKPGGMLAVMSDGIFESFSPTGKQFGVENVIASLDKSQKHPASAAAQALLENVVHWQQHDQPTDDQTIILLNRDG